jgi:hypothetical protein
MMKLRYAPVLVMLLMLPAVCMADAIDKIAALLKQGNVHELAAYFATNVDVSILEDTNVYSNTQAELILEKFFKANKPAAVTILHRINSSATYKFGVIIVKTDKGKFRVSFTLKGAPATMQIIELRIETEKT